jgi:hypothetical protein
MFLTTIVGLPGIVFSQKVLNVRPDMVTPLPGL